MKTYDPEDFIAMPIPASMFSAVCALLGGASIAAVATGSGNASGAALPAPLPPERAPEPAGTASVASGAGNAAPSEPVATSGEIDAHGHPWSEALHASTKSKTKEGLWRMKVGVSRPAPLPGFPKDPASTGATGTSENGAGAAPTPSANGPNAGPATPATDEDEDEFAAFRAAADKAAGANAAAAASVPARSWSDADLGALCNQAAVKLGDPAPVKEIIGQFVPSGQVPHSRNIPADKREEFAKAVEAKAGITFAG